MSLIMTTATTPQSKRAPRLRLRQENEGALVRVKRDILRYGERGWISIERGALGIYVRRVDLGGRMCALVLVHVRKGGESEVVAVPPEDLDLV
jgi:hypothetical protein